MIYNYYSVIENKPFSVKHALSLSTAYRKPVKHETHGILDFLFVTVTKNAIICI